MEGDVMDGWIKSHRSLLNWKYWGNHEITVLWIYLLHSANYKPEHKVNAGIMLNPGELLTSRQKIALDCCIQESKVERLLTKLEKDLQIKQVANNRYRIITIVNWQQYQSDNLKNENEIPGKVSKNIDIIEAVINYLNIKVAKNFKITQKIITLINAQIKKGAKVDDFKKIVDIKCDEWQYNDKMNKYLRPSTLFCEKHFDEYLNAYNNIYNFKIATKDLPAVVNDYDF